MSAGLVVGGGWSFAADGADDLGVALGQFLGSLRARPRLLAFGEPMHREEEFPRLRNQAFRHLVEREGYRSIAIESGCLAALVVDAFVTEGEGSLDEVMKTGFSHGFGALDSNRELVVWMREHNRNLAPEDRLRFYGFDAPTEVTGADSPREALAALHGYLATHLEAGSLPCSLETIDGLVGDDGRWTDPEAAMDPSRSIGDSREVGELRLLTDDLLSVLTSESPRLVAAASQEDWWRACLYGRTTAGLLRYHAAMADGSGTRAAQISRLMGRRDAMMYANLRDIAAREARRGPTLVFANNSHLRKKYRSGWLLPPEWGGLEDNKVSWWGAGAIAGARMGDRYAFLASALGSAPGLRVPEPDTLEGALYAVTEDRCIFDSNRLAETVRGRSPKLTSRTDVSTNYFALDPDRLDGTDGVVFIKDII